LDLFGWYDPNEGHERDGVTELGQSRR
jgi:hypothetical protein